MSSAALRHHLQNISLYLLLVGVGMVHVYHSMCVTIRTTWRSRCLPLGFRDQMQALRFDGKSLQLLIHLPDRKNHRFLRISAQIGELVPWLRASATLIKDVGSIPSNHMMAN